MTFEVVDDDDKPLAVGKDLDELQQRLRPQLRATLAEVGAGLEQRGLTSWTIGTLPRTVAQDRAGYRVTAYPALVDEGDSVAVRLHETQADADAAMALGTRRLLLLTVASPVKAVAGRLSNEAKLALSRSPHRSVPDLLADCLAAAMDRLITQAGGPAWDAAGFDKLREQVRAGVVETTYQTLLRVQAGVAAWTAAEQRLGGLTNPAYAVSLADVRDQLAGLIHPGFVAETGWAHLGDLPRYLGAVQHRLEKLPTNSQRDREQTLDVQEITQEYQQLRATAHGAAITEGLREIRWMIEELRISYFAQSMRTAYPISDKRIFKAMDALS
jgi:ATP-dependent helicase HrpA